MLSALRPFARHLRGKRGLLGAVFILGLAGSAASLASPLIGKSFIDRVVGQGDYVMVPWISAALLGLAVADLLLGTLTRWVHTKLSAAVLVEIRQRVFAHCANAPLEELESFRHGDLLSRFATDIPKIQTLLVDGAVSFIQNLLFLVVAAVILLNLSVSLALWSFVGIVAALAVTAAFRRPIETGTRGIREQMAGIGHFLAERLGALRALRLHRTQGEDAERFAGCNRKLIDKLLRFQLLDAFAGGLPGILLTASLAWIYLLGGGLLEHGEISLGTFVAFILYQGRLYAPARGLLGLVRNLQEARVSLERISEILVGEAKVPQPVGPLPVDKTGLAIEGLRFAYTGNPPLLRGLDFHAQRGSFNAIFGSSGAGKSTLVQILFGLREPQSGCVLLDGVALGLQRNPAVGGKLGYAGAEPFLLHATVEENLRYGNPRATQPEIAAAARLAEAHNFILGLPQGYQTLIGGRGLALSDGQRQRIGLARLALGNPLVLVFDEAFSALATETERLVRRNFRQHFSDRILISITPRQDGLDSYDRLLLLQDGRLRQVADNELRVALSAATQSKVLRFAAEGER